MNLKIRTSVRHDLRAFGPSVKVRAFGPSIAHKMFHILFAKNRVSLCPSGRGASTEWSPVGRKGQDPGACPPGPISAIEAHVLRALRPSGYRPESLRLSGLREHSAVLPTGAPQNATVGKGLWPLPPAPKGASHLLVLRSTPVGDSRLPQECDVAKPRRGFAP